MQLSGLVPWIERYGLCNPNTRQRKPVHRNISRGCFLVSLCIIKVGPDAVMEAFGVGSWWHWANSLWGDHVHKVPDEFRKTCAVGATLLCCQCQRIRAQPEAVPHVSALLRQVWYTLEVHLHPP